MTSKEKKYFTTSQCFVINLGANELYFLHTKLRKCKNAPRYECFVT